MKNAKILLVEDNPDDVALTLRAFRKNKLVNDVVVARDGVQALDYLNCQGEYADRDPIDRPGIILLDLKLPRIDGLEVLRRIRSNPHTSKLPVVILTTSNNRHDLDDAYQIGVNSYIRKPVDFNKFSDAIGKIGMYWLALNEMPAA